jgi:hypothetical protein
MDIMPDRLRGGQSGLLGNGEVDQYIISKFKVRPLSAHLFEQNKSEERTDASLKTMTGVDR